MTNVTSDASSSPPPPLPSVFGRYQESIDSALRDRLSVSDPFVYSMLRYAMGWSDTSGSPVSAPQGKALRPTLCLLTCEAVCGDSRRAIPPAACLELIHNFSLVHDDIQDRDEYRRHRPTLWKVWGEPKALTAGNVMRIVADATVQGLRADSVPDSEINTVNRVLTEASLEMIEGQHLDVAFEGRSDIGMQSYLDMISRKTGALIRTPMHVGAIMGTRDPKVIDSFRECGRSLGYVFQIRDDVLGIFSEEETTGKPVGADIRRKKNSLPIVHAMSQADRAQRRMLEDTYDHETVTDTDVEAVLDIMDDLGTEEFANSLAAEHCERALEALADVEIPLNSRADIEELATFLLVRQH